ncbi:MAG: hypothetical protein K9N55_06240 [Phycisphaerae bacterium]|nr:hypothetical protein [Phycisphaerae bacterium]
MIKTLRITSVLVALGAIALLGFSAVYGIDKDPEVQALLNSDGPVDRFEQNQGRAEAQKNVNTKHPLVAAAERFALLLNPPKPPQPVVPKRNPVTNRIPAVAKNIASSTQLMGICYNAQDPNLSFALMDMPGKGQRWVGLNDTIDHHVVHQILSGEVVLLNGDQRQVLAVQKKPSVSLIRGENHVGPGAASDATEDARFKSGLRPSLTKRPIGRPPVRTLPLRSTTGTLTPEERAQIFDHALAEVEDMNQEVPGMSEEELALEKIRRDKVRAALIGARDRGRLDPSDANQLHELGKQFLEGQANSDMNDI